MRTTKRRERTTATALAEAISKARGQWIRAMREQAQMTSVEFASKLQVSVQMVSQVEKGVRGLPGDKHELMQSVLRDGIAKAQARFRSLLNQPEFAAYMPALTSACKDMMIGQNKPEQQRQVHAQ